mmetsp:Transcript_10393/g.30385  ORF Transcript_10393/g.30385 Transcript_10393/m.30385 type:complete len:775 (-) Transcript_10393:4031-6355(-)
MTVLVAAAPTSEDCGVSQSDKIVITNNMDGGVSVPPKKSSSMPSSQGKSSGFQRGFLLGSKPSATKGKRRKRQEKPVDKTPIVGSPLASEPVNRLPQNSKTETTTNNNTTLLPQGLSSKLPETTGKHSVVEKGPEETASGTERASGKKKTKKKNNDSGWAKGFLTTNTGNSSKETTTRTKPKAKSATSGASKANQSSNTMGSGAAAKKKKDSGWAKGFLTNSKKKGNNHKTKTATDDQATKTKAKIPPVSVLEAKGLPTMSSASSSVAEVRPSIQSERTSQSSDWLLSIEESGTASEDQRTNLFFVTPTTPWDPTVARTSSEGPTTQNSRSLICVLGGNEDENTTDASLPLGNPDPLSSTGRQSISKPVQSPFISVVSNEEEDSSAGLSSSIFLQEVSATRKPRHEQSAAEEWPRVRHRSAPLQEVSNEQSNPKKGSLVVSSSIATIEAPADHKEPQTATTTAGVGIVAFQQELERLCAREMASSGSDTADGTGADRLEHVRMLSWTSEQRRCSWICLLRQHQKRQQKQQKLPTWGTELFETEYCNSNRQQPRQEEQQHRYDESTSSSITISLESILQSFGTAEDRVLALQAVQVIREYFLAWYQSQDEQEDELSEATTSRQAPLWTQGIPRLVPALCRLVRSAGNRRTRLAQTAWETSVLLVASFLRGYASASTEATTKTKSGSSGSDNGATRALLEQLQWLVQIQLIWQQAKEKKHKSGTATTKLRCLQGLERSAENMVSSMGKAPRGIVDDALSALINTTVADLETLLELK